VRARKLIRALLAVAVAAGAAVTCESPTTPARHMVALAIQPVLKVALGSFGGLAVDSARVTVVRPPETVVATKTFYFPPDVDQINATVSVSVTDTATFDVSIQLLSGATTMFCGADTLLVTSSLSAESPAPIPLQYCGPGTNVAAIQIAPRDTSVALGASLQYRLTAMDSSQKAVTQFYAGWSTTPGSPNTVNANGLFRAGKTGGTVWVYAHTPTGIQDSTRITVIAPQAGVPANIAKTAGDGQSAQVGTAVAVAPAVTVTDGFGAAVSGATVTFAVASGGGSVTGGTATTNASGVATVGSWTLGSTAGTNTLTASVASLPAATFTATATGVVLPGIQLTVPGNLVGVGGQGLALVKLLQPAPSGGVTVTVTSDSTKYLTVASPGTIAFAQGDTLKSITLTGVAVGVSILHATATGYSAGITAVPVTPDLILLQSPFSLAVGQSASLSIQLVPAAATSGFVVTLASTDTTKLKITTPTVTFAAAQASGSATVQAVAAGLVGVTATATGYAPGATAVTVMVTAGPAKTLSLVSGGNQSATPGTQLPQPIVVKVADSGGVGVSAKAVTFAVATGGGSVGTPNATTDANGLASTTWTLGTAAGLQTITASSAGLTGSPLTISANAPSGVKSTVVVPKLDTITAINGTFTLVAQAKDSAGSNLTGSFTWTSRTPTIASVSTLGVVTGLANGSTWVVATEAGGTKDSAQIVVHQKLASITVTPANRNLYLGTTFNYTAAAVDGLGTALPSNPAFTWSTTAPAVATVDTAGHVAAIGLGTAQIKATSGTITGVGNLSVLTAITRIAVAVDSSGATKTDTASLPSLGVTRRYHAYAYDTLNALMSAVTQFTWASTNPSVAGVPNVTADTVTATSAANGVTAINATAQGFTSKPGAALTVSQVLASIQLSPAAATVGVTGSVALTARGRDANSRYISGGSFSFVSKNPAIATVGATSGLVTGVVIGTDTVVADSGALTSNPSIITVAASVPAAISFGRDTVSVGRGSSASIPILLSTPLGTGGQLIVKLGVSPAAYAHWSTATVTVPAGATSVNATLVGDSAGTTTVTATDSSSGTYTAGSAVAKVTANMNLASSYYTINTTDIVTTQVLLSDPSPAGGTYVTFNFGTAGIASVSPNPAFIPAGQLAADIQINALAAGTTTITPQAIGVNGSASTFTANAPVLTLYPTYNLLGLGQYAPNVGYVYLPTSTYVALPVKLTSSDTTKVTVTPTVTIPVNNNYQYYAITSVGLGRAAITPSAPGWTAANTDSVIVTTPHVGVCCSYTIYTTAGTQTLTIYTEDSTNNVHYRTNSLLVSLRSSDTTVMKVIDTTITVAPGTYYAYPRVTPAALGGTAYLIASASGHTSDSVLYTVNGPPLAFSWGSRVIGVGQQDINSNYVYVPNSVTSPLVVRLTGTDSTKVGAPDSVIIPKGSNYVYFTVQGLAVGTDTFTATAPGFQTATGATYAVTPPAIILNNTSYTFNNYNTGSNFYVYSADTTRGTHYRITPDTISVVVRDTTVATLDSATVIIAAGQVYSSYRHVTPAGVGSTYVVLSAGGGQRVLDSLLVTVNTPTIYFNFGSTILGRRQHLNPSGQGFYVYTPDSRTVAVPATMVQKQATVDSLSTLTPTIPANYNYVYLDAFGLSKGTDTLTVSATGYNSGNPAYITVTTPKLGGAGLPSATNTTNLSAIGVYVYAQDSIDGYTHYTMDTVTVHAVSSDTTVLKVDSAYYHIPKNSYYVPTSVHVSGPGSAYVVFSDSANSGYLPDTTNTMTVTGPSLYFSTSSTVLGMRQTTGPSGIYVYTQNTPASPVVVHLKSTATTVVTVPDSVTIPTTTNYVYFPVNAMDTIGTIQVQATATGFGAAAMSVQVTRPEFTISTTSQLNTTSPRYSIYVYARDANGTAHYATDSVVVKLASSATSVATIDSATVTIPKGQYYNGNATWGPASLSTPGTAQLSATDTTHAFYAYTPATFNVAVVTPSLGLTWGTQTLGIGQYSNNYVYSPNTATAPIVVSLSHPGTQRTTIKVNGVAVSVDTIPTNSSSTGYFHVVGTAVGWDTLVASASSPPFNSATAYTAVSQGHVDQLGNWPTTLSLSTNDSVLVYLYARDSTLGTHPVQDSTTFTLAPNSFIQFVTGGATSTVITSVVIPKDQYYVTFYVKGVSQGTGQATISGTNYVAYNTPAITVSP